jgi:hypothetical protein
MVTDTVVITASAVGIVVVTRMCFAANTDTSSDSSSSIAVDIAGHLTHTFVMVVVSIVVTFARESIVKEVIA